MELILIIVVVVLLFGGGGYWGRRRGHCRREDAVRRRGAGGLPVRDNYADAADLGRLVSVEESWPFAGIGSEMAALMMEQAFDHLDAPVVRVTGKDVPLPYAANLEKLALAQPEDIVEAVKNVCYRQAN